MAAATYAACAATLVAAGFQPGVCGTCAIPRAFVRLRAGRQDATGKTLCEGSHVGRKRIAWFQDAVVSTIRLRTVESAAEPLIRCFQAFHVANFRLAEGQPLPSPWRQWGFWRAADFKAGKAQLNLDLTSHLAEAGQWEVVFQPSGGEVAVKEATMIEDGVPAVAGMLQHLPDQPQALHLNRAATITKESHLQLNVVLEGPPSDGVIQIRQVAP